MKSLWLAAQLLRREWRAGELGILLLAILIAVTCMTSINLFAERIHLALVNQSSDLVGADLVLSSPNPLPNTWVQQAHFYGLKTTTSLHFFSMLSANKQLQLADVSAVSPGYPLRGNLKIAAAKNTEQITHAIPSSNTIWVETDLLASLHIKPGDNLKLGAGTFNATHILTYQPEISENFNFSPHALINFADIDKTKVVQPGSRLSYSVYFSGNTKQLKLFSSWVNPQLIPGQKLVGAGESNPSLQKSLERVQHYLGLGSLISVILAGIAIIVALKHFSLRHADTVALMRCYGASSRQVLFIYIWLLVGIGIVGIVLASIIGFFAQDILARNLASIIQIDLPPSSFSGVWFGAVAGFWVLLTFGLPPLWQLTRVPPARVLRRELAPLSLSSAWLYISGLIGISALVFWHTQDSKVAVIILLGCLGACFLFLLGAGILIAITHQARGKVGVAWRYGLANLARRWQTSILQISAFGFILMVLLLLIIVRNNLVVAWQKELPPTAPNFFIINIAPDQITGLKQQLAQIGIQDANILPMVRGRIVNINHQSVNQLPANEREDESLNRELNLSWTEAVPHNNSLTQGLWWARGDGRVISVEQGLAQRLGLHLGDDLSFRIGSQSITAKVKSIRQLNWSSLEPNFYILFPPNVLENFPTTYITSFYLPPQKTTQALTGLIQQFPNFSIINIAEIVKHIQSLLTQASNSVRYLFFFAFLAGLLVLYATVYTTLDQRLWEAAILRALGASRYQIVSGLAAEFLIVGAFAGLLAGAVANVIGMQLGKRLFELTLHFSSALLFIGMVAGALLITMVGLFATRKVVFQSPLLSLRSGARGALPH